MSAKRDRCRICLKWFVPSAHEGKRQQVCGRRACQKERHRRDCAAWRKRNPDYDREDRLRRRIRAEETPETETRKTVTPLAGFRWDKVRDAVGLEVAVVVEETGAAVAAFSQSMQTERNGPRTGGKEAHVSPR